MQGGEGRSVLWRVFRLTAGWSLIVIGVVGLFVPLLQGILFIASGLALLSTENRWARAVLDRFSAWRKVRREDRDPP